MRRGLIGCAATLALAGCVVPGAPLDPEVLSAARELEAELVETPKEVANSPDLAEVVPAPAEAVPTGREIARVGDEVITLPMLTAAVKERIADQPKEDRLTRRQVIEVARSSMESMVARSIVRQVAIQVLGSEAAVDEATNPIEKRWSDEEIPRLLVRERLSKQEDLLARLNRRGQPLEALHDAYIGRELARVLMQREGVAGDDVDAYLASLKDRVKVTSILDPKDSADEVEIEP